MPKYIPSHNGMEFKNQLMDDVLQQYGIDCIFSNPYHWQSNEKLEVFHKYLKPTLKNQYLNQVLLSLCVTSTSPQVKHPSFSSMGETPIFPHTNCYNPCNDFSVTQILGT